jgi:hypothetical protein
MRLGAPDGLVWGDDEVHPEVVDGFGQAPGCRSAPTTPWRRWL